MNDLEPRSLRWAMHAFPRRWRQARGDELIDVVNQNGISPHVLLDLVISGWRTRLRDHPPLLSWLGYRLFAKRLDRRWHDWIRDDIDGRFFWLRHLAFIAMIQAFGASASFLVVSADDVQRYTWLVFWVSYFFVGPLLQPRYRKQARKRFLSAESAPRQFVWQTVWQPPARRYHAVPLLVAVAIATMPIAPFAAWSLLVASPGHVDEVVAGSAAAGLGIALAVTAAAGRLSRRLSLRAPVEVPGAVPSTSASRSTLTMIVALAWVLGAGGCLLQRHAWIPSIYSIAQIVAGVGIAPACLLVAAISRRIEQAAGQPVRTRDVWLALFGSSDVIAAEVGRYAVVPAPYEPLAASPHDVSADG